MVVPGEVRGFRVGDSPALVEAWAVAAPVDAVSRERFRDLVLLDANFDPGGLRVAVVEGRVVGAAYAVRRRVAMVGGDLEPRTGWVPFFFVVPAARRRGFGEALLRSALDWLRGHGVTEAWFSPYTPNYVLPGLDTAAYPDAERLLRRLGFEARYDAAAMDLSLVGYAVPADVRERADALRGAGYRFGTPTDDELVDVVRLAGEEFNPDWARAIRAAVVGGTPTDRVVCAWAPDGALVGWAMHAAYENALARFGPFGVVPSSRGTGLGKVLLHLTLERMRARGAHGAWFLWTGEQTPAGHLYRASGFTTTRLFTVMRTEL